MGWEEHEDAEGNQYYHNECTRTTSWTRPTGPPIAQQTGAGKGWAATERKETRTRQVRGADVRGGMRGVGGSFVEVPLGAGPLPSGWEAHRDDSGDVYFYHANQRRVTWSRPAPEVEHLCNMEM